MKFFKTKKDIEHEKSIQEGIELMNGAAIEPIKTYDEEPELMRIRQMINEELGASQQDQIKEIVRLVILTLKELDKEDLQFIKDLLK